MGFVQIFICLIVVVSAVAEDTPFHEAFPLSNEEDFAQLAEEVSSFRKEKVAETQPFAAACPTIPIPVDTSDVTKLKPGNIKVVMAMGDSITAAMSAKDTNILLLKEYRGIAYATGGDAGVVTFPNILKQYTASGYPIGPSTGIGKRTMATNGLNGAVSGAINIDMRGQAEWLVTELKKNTKINLSKDWKVLTIWIGSNNICDVCNNDELNNAKDFYRHIMAALDYFYVNVPRLFVNLVANLDITQIYDISSGACGLLHPQECPCPSSKNAAVRDGVKTVIKQYVSTAYDIQANFTQRKNPEFAVVVQPFLVESPVYNRSFLSAADCFHPSAISHEAASVALWNSMITPLNNKAKSWVPGQLPICPTADTIIYAV